LANLEGDFPLEQEEELIHEKDLKFWANSW
jgi:hypothetical protein